MVGVVDYCGASEGFFPLAESAVEAVVGGFNRCAEVEEDWAWGWCLWVADECVVDVLDEDGECSELFSLVGGGDVLEVGYCLGEVDDCSGQDVLVFACQVETYVGGERVGESEQLGECVGWAGVVARE